MENRVRRVFISCNVSRKNQKNQTEMNDRADRATGPYTYGYSTSDTQYQAELRTCFFSS